MRNFVLVGGLKYFYEKSGSEVLFYLHQFALFVIFLYCLSYADQWYVNLFGFLSNRRLAHFLRETSICSALHWVGSCLISGR